MAGTCPPKGNIMPKKTYTTSEIAKELDVYPMTVARWIDNGELKAFITPGKHRRVSKEDLIEFCKKHNKPLPFSLEIKNRNKILIIDDDKKLIDVVIELNDLELHEPVNHQYKRTQ